MPLPHLSDLVEFLPVRLSDQTTCLVPPQDFDLGQLQLLSPRQQASQLFRWNWSARWLVQCSLLTPAVSQPSEAIKAVGTGAGASFEKPSHTHTQSMLSVESDPGHEALLYSQLDQLKTFPEKSS